MRIAVIGSGYVGLVSAACFAEIGHDVISVDNDSVKIATLERGGVPIHERFLPELLARHRGRQLTFSRRWPNQSASRMLSLSLWAPRNQTRAMPTSPLLKQLPTKLHPPFTVQK